MDVEIRRWQTGPLATNTYTIIHGSEAILIDPSNGCDSVISYLSKKKANLLAILLTHGHFDHFLGIDEILAFKRDCPIYLHSYDLPFIRDPEANGSILCSIPFSFNGRVMDIVEGEIQIGDFNFKIFHIPGHSPGGCAFLLGNDCFCGDVIFAGSIGRIDLPGGDGIALIKNIKEKIMQLPENTTLHPGHGGRTSIGREKRMNPYLQ